MLTDVRMRVESVWAIADKEISNNPRHNSQDGHLL